MRTLSCPKCGRVQPSGKFCLDCGGQLVEKVTLGVKFNTMETARPADTIKKDIRKWLTRIGVQNGDIIIETIDGISARVRYALVRKKYEFTSFRQRRFVDNLAAVEMFLHHRVLGIERGIETTEQAFAGYTALPAPKTLETMSDTELRELLKKHHPDTGDGNVEEMMKVKVEIDKRAR
jgi:hypothetical protein